MGQVKTGRANIHSPAKSLLAFFVEQFVARNLTGYEFLFLTAALVNFVSQYIGGFQCPVCVNAGYKVAMTGVNHQCAVSGDRPAVVFVTELFNSECGTVRLCDGDGHTQCRGCLDEEDNHAYRNQCNQFFHLVMLSRLQNYKKKSSFPKKSVGLQL